MFFIVATGTSTKKVTQNQLEKKIFQTVTNCRIFKMELGNMQAFYPRDENVPILWCHEPHMLVILNCSKIKPTYNQQFPKWPKLANVCDTHFDCLSSLLPPQELA